MADFVESAKNFMSAAVSRTSWEAQKQMRIRGKQGEIDKLEKQKAKLLDELGKTAIQLYEQGALNNPQLARFCSSIIELNTDMQAREVQLQEIKKESYPAEQFAPNPTTNYTPPMTNTPPPASAPKAKGAQQAPQVNTCPTCGSTVRPNALYCRNCGTKLR